MPKFFKKGDAVSITATVRKIDVQNLATAIPFQESWELKVDIRRTIDK